MQSQPSAFGAGSGHRRRPSLGKARPVTELLLNFPPPSLAALRYSQACDGDGAGASADVDERPPLYFNVDELKDDVEPVENLKKREPITEMKSVQELEHELPTEQLKMEKPNEAKDNEVFSADEQDYEILVSDYSNEGSDDDDDQSEKAALIGGANNDYTPCLTCTGNAPPHLAMSSLAINEMCRRLCSEDCRLRLSLGGYVPPDAAALQAKATLTQMVCESLRPKTKEPPHNNANAKTTIAEQRQHFMRQILQDEECHQAAAPPCRDDANKKLTALSSHELAHVSHRLNHEHDQLQQDLREKSEIAEALAKTSAMTSTSKMKQRLAARKLEIELDNRTSVSAATGAAADALPLRANKIADFVAATENGSEYEPPRELLLYLVRMGSFNSAPKILNIDSQDDGLEVPKGLSTNELLLHVKHLRGETKPPLLTRYFLKPLDAQTVSHDITDGLRILKLDAVSRVCSAPITPPNLVRLLQWNILSQSLGQNNDGFVCCPEQALTWENRKFLIVQEILQTNPDIICLQEVDHFKFLQKLLGTQNYDGIFFPKPDSPCLYIEENNGPDGCAIFYKRDKYDLRNFDTRILEVWHVQSNQVAIAANFRNRATGAEICVCTTHLKARHGSLLSKLRNEQGRDLIRFVKKVAEERAILLCGDFNAEPVEPVYSTILNGEISNLSSAYADISEEVEPCMDHTEKQDAEDKTATSMKREPAYTTWKIREDGEVCHTIDYVFYSKDRLKVKNCLEFPQGEEIGKNRTPSFQYPSDHFSLVCDFEILDQQ